MANVVCGECDDQGRCVTVNCLTCRNPFAASQADDADEVLEVDEDNEEPPGGPTHHNQFSPLVSDVLFLEFERHTQEVRKAHVERREALEFRASVENMEDQLNEVNASASQDIDDGLGVRLSSDEFQGDTNFRTLQALLTRIDQRGFERYAFKNSNQPFTLKPPFSHRFATLFGRKPGFGLSLSFAAFGFAIFQDLNHFVSVGADGVMLLHADADRSRVSIQLTFYPTSFQTFCVFFLL